MNAETFNSRYPVGTPVFAYPACRPEDVPSDRRLVTRTRSRASVLGGHTDVVWVEDHSSCIALSHVDVVTEDEWKAAKTAEATVTERASMDTLPAWLYQRFAVIHGAPPWDRLTDSERPYWEHQARAVRRAVARDGFKAEEASS